MKLLPLLFLLVTTTAFATEISYIDVVPKPGDSYSKIASSDSGTMSVNLRDIKIEGDLRSVKTLTVHNVYTSRTTGIAGHASVITFNCKLGTFRIVASYFLDKKATVMGENKANIQPDFVPVRVPSNGAAIFEAVCGHTVNGAPSEGMRM